MPGSWLGFLPDDVKYKVDAATRVRNAGNWEGSGNWWLQQTPSTSMARDADLILKRDDGHVISREPVMRASHPVGRFA